MSSIAVPNYPVVMVDVRADGSAHVNVAGRHVDYPAGDVTETRAAVTAYAVTLAQSLNRPVRMTTSGPDGTWTLAVHPGGDVTDLSEEAAKPKRRRRTPRRPTAIEPEDTLTIEPTTGHAAPAVDRTDVVEISPDAPAADPRRVLPTATLTFSTGAIAQIRATTLIGRRPHLEPGEDTTELLSIDDDSRTISKTHARLEWVDGQLWITDRYSANGTSAQRSGEHSVELAAGQSHPLHAGDIVRLGEVSFTVAMSEGNQ